MNLPRLKFLHAEHVELKLETLRRKTTKELIESLSPGETHSLKVKKDGTIMDGNHRIKVLIERAIDVDQLPREIWDRIE